MVKFLIDKLRYICYTKSMSAAAFGLPQMPVSRTGGSAFSYNRGIHMVKSRYRASPSWGNHDAVSTVIFRGRINRFCIWIFRGHHKTQTKRREVTFSRPFCFHRVCFLVIGASALRRSLFLPAFQIPYFFVRTTFLSDHVEYSFLFAPFTFTVL